MVGNAQIREVDQILIQPLPVGLARGIGLLERLIPDDPPGPGVHQQHPPGLQTGLFHDTVCRDIQHPHLRGENQAVVRGHIVSGGAQAVAVQDRAHHIAVREEDGCGAVPRLHQNGVVLIEVPLGP